MKMEWMPKLCALAVVLLLAAPAAVAAEVTFADANLEAAVRAELGIPAPTPITEADMAELTGLVIENSGGPPITSLAGLEYATSLEGLSIDCDTIGDAMPIGGLPALTNVMLQGGNLLGLDAFRGMGQLEHLALWDSKVDALGDMSDLKNLRGLDITGQSLDLSGLAGHSSLTLFAAPNSGVTQIDALADETSLYTLYLPGNAISNISSIEGMSQLGFVDLAMNHISILPDVSGLSNLLSLDLSGNYIANIEPLTHLSVAPNVSITIDLRGNPLSDEAYGTHLPLLEHAYPKGMIMYDPIPEPTAASFLVVSVLSILARCRRSVN